MFTCFPCLFLRKFNCPGCILSKFFPTKSDLDEFSILEDKHTAPILETIIQAKEKSEGSDSVKAWITMTVNVAKSINKLEADNKRLNSELSDLKARFDHLDNALQKAAASVYGSQDVSDANLAIPSIKPPDDKAAEDASDANLAIPSIKPPDDKAAEDAIKPPDDKAAEDASAAGIEAPAALVEGSRAKREGIESSETPKKSLKASDKEDSCIPSSVVKQKGAEGINERKRKFSPVTWEEKDENAVRDRHSRYSHAKNAVRDKHSRYSHAKRQF